jgi:acetyl-CoA C-acetyltransferase
MGMGAATENYTKIKQISREEQDVFSAASHERVAAAMKDGVFTDEIVPVAVPQRRGEPVLVTDDEGVRPETTAESLARLRPAFAADGTVTAGSSQISDGACAVVVMSKARAQELGVPVLAEIGAHGVVAGPDPSLLSQPANAIKKALAGKGLARSRSTCSRSTRRPPR